MNIFITTGGRVDRQVTWNNLPPEVRKSARIVCPPGEVSAHQQRGRNVIACLRDNRGLAEKRQWLLEYCQRNKLGRVVFLDDDLKFQHRRADMRITNSEPAEIVEAFNWLDESLKTYAHAGFQARTLSFASTDDVELGQRHMYVLGYNVVELMKHGASFSKGLPPLASMSDFYMTLQLLTKGLPNRMSLIHRVTAYASNAPGGCSAYRTAQTIERSAKTLAKLFPEFVKPREKKGWNGVGETQTDVTIFWKRALAAGTAKP